LPHRGNFKLINVKTAFLRDNAPLYTELMAHNCSPIQTLQNLFLKVREMKQGFGASLRKILP